MDTVAPERDKAVDAREVAAFISKGLTPEDVAAKVDLPLPYVNDLTQEPEFLKALEHVGGKSALNAWNEYIDERRARATMRSMVRDRLKDYFNVLDTIAMDATAKQEVRSNTIRFLLLESGVLKEEAPPPQTQELPHTFFAALAQATREMDQSVLEHD